MSEKRVQKVYAAATRATMRDGGKHWPIACAAVTVRNDASSVWSLYR